MKWKREGFEIEVKDLTQKHIEDWSAELPNVKEVTVSKYRGDIIRAAVTAGWFEGEPIGSVCDMKPQDVVWLAEQIADLYNELTTLSPS